MKPLIKKTALTIAVASLLSLSACNDNNTDSTPLNKSTSGVITGFGSVFINGVEYETDDASFVVDGVEGGEELLALGMVVSLSGVDDGDGTGNALSIEFENDVEGVVINSTIDANNIGTLNIMGVTVHVDEDTVFESKADAILTASDIVAGNIIEVSGHSSGDGDVWATRLEVKSSAKEDGKEMEVKGTVSSLDETNETFVLGSLTINYSDAEVELDDDVTSLADDMFVKVKSDVGIVDDALVASKIELKDGGKKKIKHKHHDDEVELQGIITAVTSSTLIEVNGHAVILSDTTRYVHGSAAIAAVGLKVKIKGDLNDNGDFVANKVMFKPSGDVKMEGKISATDVASNTITVFGVPLTLNNSALVKDDREDDDLGDDEENVKYKFGVDDLAVDNWVKVKAHTNKDGNLIVSKMTRKTFEAGDDQELEGKLSYDTVSKQYYVAGINVDLSNSGFTPVDGNKVEFKGVFENGAFIVTEGEEKEEDEHYISGKDDDKDDKKEDKHDDDDNSNHQDD